MDSSRQARKDTNTKCVATEFDSTRRKIDEALVQKLATSNWIDDHFNVANELATGMGELNDWDEQEAWNNAQSDR